MRQSHQLALVYGGGGEHGYFLFSLFTFSFILVVTIVVNGSFQANCEDETLKKSIYPRAS